MKYLPFVGLTIAALAAFLFFGYYIWQAQRPYYRDVWLYTEVQSKTASEISAEEKSQDQKGYERWRGYYLTSLGFLVVTVVLSAGAVWTWKKPIMTLEADMATRR